MSWITPLYTLATRAGAAIAPLLLRGDGKAARSVRARSGAVDALVRWGAAERDPNRPLAWFHAPSVGEGLQARAVIEEVRTLAPEAQLLFTHFSPSAEGLAGRMPVDCAGYLPWDLPSDWVRILDAVRPGALVFTKTEVWPNLTAAAAARGVPVILTAATLPTTSSRRGGGARALLSESYARLAGVHAIAEEDARRIVELGARPDAVQVMGDPGIDSAAARVRGTDPGAPWIAPFRGHSGPTLVAGSTWPEDEERLVEAATSLRDGYEGLRLIVAPHEPDEKHLGPLEARLGAAGWRTSRLGTVEREGDPGSADAIVVDRIGVLAGLYTVAQLAYVGGGFGTDGLHSVLEPAAAGVPVIVGPNHHSSAAALDLVREGGAVAVPDAGTLREAVARWLDDARARATSTEVVTRYIDRHRGAAARSAAAVADHLKRPAGASERGTP